MNSINRMFLRPSLFVALVVGFLSANFFSEFPAFAAPADNARTTVGLIVPLTGAFARYGQKIQEGVLRAAPALSFISEDEGCDPAMAVRSYKKLSTVDGVKIFLGPWCGSPQSAVAPFLKQHDQVAILGSSAPSAVYELSGERMFSTQHTIEEESTFLGKEMSRLGVKRVAIVYFENAFSKAHEAAFRRSFSGSIAETFAYTSQDSLELRAIALRIKALNVDALYVPDAFPILAGFPRLLRNIGIGDLPLYAVYSLQSQDVKAIVEEAGATLIYSYPDIGNEDALEHFPRAAADITIKATAQCGVDPDCIASWVKKNYAIGPGGAIPGKLILKTIRDHQFLPLSDQSTVVSTKD